MSVGIVKGGDESPVWVFRYFDVQEVGQCMANV